MLGFVCVSTDGEIQGAFSRENAPCISPSVDTHTKPSMRPLLPAGRAGRDTAAALGAFARTWIQGLPRTADYRYDSDDKFLSPALSLEFIPEIMTDERIRRCFAQLIALDALVLGATLDKHGAPDLDPN